MGIIDLRRNHKFESELWSAIKCLASNSMDIKKRLERVYEYHLIYLEPDFIPQGKNRKKFTRIKNKLTKNHTARVCEAIYHLPLKSCRSIAKDICDIYWEFTHYEWHHNS